MDSYEKVSRNDMCPCGSGLKYKKCCIKKEHVKNTLLSKKILPVMPTFTKSSNKENTLSVPSSAGSLKGRVKLQTPHTPPFTPTSTDYRAPEKKSIFQQTMKDLKIHENLSTIEAFEETSSQPLLSLKEPFIPTEI